MLNCVHDLSIRSSDKFYLGNKPNTKELSPEVIKCQKLALKCYSCLSYLLRVAGRLDLSDEIDELLELAFIDSKYSIAKEIFSSNPVKPMDEFRRKYPTKSTSKFYNQYYNTIRSGIHRLTALCGENWYKHISTGIDDIKNFKLNCISEVYNPYNDAGIIDNVEQFKAIWGILGHTVMTVITLKNEYAKTGMSFVIPSNTKVGDMINTLITMVENNENYFKLLVDNIQKNGGDFYA